MYPPIPSRPKLVPHPTFSYVSSDWTGSSGSSSDSYSLFQVIPISYVPPFSPALFISFHFDEHKLYTYIYRVYVYFSIISRTDIVDLLARSTDSEVQKLISG